MSPLSKHGTAPISDALDQLGVNGGLPGLARVSGRGVVSGPAFTLRFEQVEPGQPGPAADFIDDVPAGSVIVIANEGRTHCTVWGDILTGVALARGIAGTVIDGCCRDVDDTRELGYSVWSLGGYMKSGKNRVRLAEVQVPVVVGGVLIRPGDVVCGDGSGVVVVPAELAADVADRVERIAAMEALVRADLDEGVPLAEARRRRGYNAAALPTAADRPSLRAS
ncbi:RraA family protein [Acrocarpospora catenulata]|uniref:RraA family protein n=1 Tax=Acrocarpospora catenulata TaxID=2836182 RepID=UPI001BD99592|nr:RraA family protein [Acrocarpospora catenulata]